MAKDRLSISLDPEIKEKLTLYADKNHKSISQAVTDWVLRLKVDELQAEKPKA